ncbi:FBP domain-containing protein [Geodermatophilus sp. DF01-2]|uniref:FBP domain-containing protein n=1 Tax=Geodermatophilus sp. DF01-2 TaxID=2559610 RepID=UPI001073E5C3|nr:FBP domain-containing protein [Geodermatophilus sp. DF01_2]TFV64085.1 FBP domain-containing protein [Geodermatophilus sp. DF01_2]
MRPITEQQLRRSFVNCSRGEADAMTLPRTFAATPCDELVVLGWRDPEAPLRGYLVVERDGQPVGVAVRAADTRMSSATPAMCPLCQTAQSGSDVSLFTARRKGDAGRDGNTVGTYICADLACAIRARTEIPPWLRERDPDEVAAERTAELEQRVRGFLDAVLR